MKVLTRFDKTLIKAQYGSIKAFKQCKKTQRDNDLLVIALDEKVKESSLINQFIEGIKAEDKRKILLDNKIEIGNKLVKVLSYSDYIILYDLFNGSYYNLTNDINKSKITINNVISVIDKINGIHDIVNKNQVLEFIDPIEQRNEIQYQEYLKNPMD